MLHLEVITNESCGCCHEFLRTLNDFTQIHTDIEFAESDISQHKGRDIKGLPYTIVYRNNVEVGVILGNMRMDILEMQLKRFQK